ncbi:glycerophosphoryl diester phosphodiesterase membrane domain-containing protein [Microbacterium sp. KSW2-29]|uniref:Glycerophosphoryl diester phosphodiesterase membrane domain-containing protein n=1 Tax=Microbacterium phycohabitans TaxID=3075993 RepID=A0ABU3SHW5_9MICO|nr:glycerophosphoryl diester phosphodiesterase membrane domain-containing protein [Microbacterium sp. KSW2-29]MDU0344390.1 glycerophosphoryl diester phosphodiesterase membrane domain-containing protein [Microbacterium sp. KSW2-29]
MTAYPAWTPASRPGIVPLHPYGFGTILGRSFVALRHNPKVLLGFALIVQAVAYIVLTAAVGGVAVASFSRLDTVPIGSDDYDAILAGSAVITGATALVLGLATGALSVIVQGVVVSEVAHAVVAEKPSLRAVWARVKPVVWRLIGYSALYLLATIVVIGVLAGIVTLLVISVLWLGIAVGVLFVLGLIVVSLWLTPKLFLVPSVIILERAPIFRAVARSWQLTRGRFWSTLGVVVIISVAFSIVAQIISVPFSLVAGIVSGILAPTGEDAIGALIGVIALQVVGQFGILLVQCIALVVQSTSAVLVYVDARMRVEALDHDLNTYVEQRDAGAADLADPYLIGVGRVVERPAPTPTGAPPAFGGYAAPASPPGYGAPQAYGAGAPQAYGAPAYGAPATAPTPSTPAPTATTGADAATPGASPVDVAPPHSEPGTAPSPAPTTWAAPGSSENA